jgi:hypothetical protein
MDLMSSNRQFSASATFLLGLRFNPEILSSLRTVQPKDHTLHLHMQGVGYSAKERFSNKDVQQLSAI